MAFRLLYLIAIRLDNVVAGDVAAQLGISPQCVPSHRPGPADPASVAGRTPRSRAPSRGCGYQVMHPPLRARSRRAGQRHSQVACPDEGILRWFHREYMGARFRRMRGVSTLCASQVRGRDLFPFRAPARTEYPLVMRRREPAHSCPGSGVHAADSGTEPRRNAVTLRVRRGRKAAGQHLAGL